MNGFNKVSPDELSINPFEKIGKDWMLITAGQPGAFNTMTASWGGLGVLWRYNVATCFVRPTRFTNEFMEKNDMFTLSFFGDEYKEALTFCGKNSGRDFDKCKETGLEAVDFGGCVSFKQASLVLVCRKVYTDVFKPENFLLPEIDHHYPLKDYHIIYVGEIKSCYTK